MLFYHRGAQGDIIYSLPTIIANGGGDLCLGNEKYYENLKELLSIQPYINKVLKLNEIKWEDISHNLDIYRKVHRNSLCKHLCRCHLEPLGVDYDLRKPWLQCIKALYKAKIIVSISSRYHDKKEIDWSLIKEYKDDCLFVGDKNSYAYFYNNYKISLPFYFCKNALEFAQIIKGSKLFMGNQSLGFALAEAMKHPRILEVYYAKNNCLPQTANGHTSLSKETIEFYLNNDVYVSDHIKEESIKKSFMLSEIYKKRTKPIVLLPNYGEFGCVPVYLMKMFEHIKAPEKIVCCKKGEEVYYPSATGYFYDWKDFVDEPYKWGAFTKKSKAGGLYRVYQKQLGDDCTHITNTLGEKYEYIHAWKINKDQTNTIPFQHLFKVDLDSRYKKGFDLDVIISPRKRGDRSENNYDQWEYIAEQLIEKGYSVGAVGTQEQSQVIKGVVNSWDQPNNFDNIIEMIKNCKLYLGLDTGVSHLASLLHVSMIVFSHSNQRYYLTHFMEQNNINYFKDLGKKVKDPNIIINKAVEFLQR